MKPTDPDHIVIKVTDGKDKAYFVHFDRATRELVSMFAYTKLYASPGPLTPRNKIIVDLAKSRIGMPREETNQPQETTT